MALAKRPLAPLKSKQDINPSIDRNTEVVAQDFADYNAILEDHANLIDSLTRANDSGTFYGVRGSLALFQAEFPNAVEGYGVIYVGNGNPEIIATVTNGVWTATTNAAPIQLYATKTARPQPGVGNVIYIVKDEKILSFWYDGSYKDFGRDGYNGKSTYQIALDFGFVGDEPAWLESLQGKDNYQLWLDAGNVGTYADFFEASRGPEGPPGSPGPPGDGADLSNYYNKTEVDAADADLAIQIDAAEEDILDHESRIFDLENNLESFLAAINQYGTHPAFESQNEAIIWLLGNNSTNPSEPNTAPTMFVNDQSIVQGYVTETIDLSQYSYDADGDALSYTAVSDNEALATVSVTGNILTITEVAGIGTANITIDCSDGTVVIQDTFELTVVDAIPTLTVSNIQYTSADTKLN